MKVKDEDGRVLPGLVRTKGGLVAVVDKGGYDKYKKDKILHNEVASLNSEVATLREQMAKILQQINRE